MWCEIKRNKYWQVDKKKLKIALDVLSNTSTTFPITKTYIEHSLLDIYSGEHLTVEKVFLYFYFGFIIDSCLFFLFFFSKALSWIMVCYATNQKVIKKAARLAFLDQTKPRPNLAFFNQSQRY